MRVRVNKLLNKRLWPSTGNKPLPEPLIPNDILNVVEVVEGEPVVPGNTKWYKTDQNFLVYSGGTTPLTFDPYWGIRKLNVDKIWSEFSVRGEGARIVVLDSGITPHADFGNRVTFHDVVSSLKDPLDEDDSHHGSSCCGIIGGDNVRAYGVAPECSLLVARVMQNTYSVTPESIAAGIDWALKQHAQQSIHAISISIVLLQTNALVAGAVAKAIDAGISVIAASGNYQGARDFYPAAFPSVISVGAMDEELKKMNKSATSKMLDFLAPGSKVETVRTDKNGGIFSGTSAATAYVAGCYALFWSFIKSKNMNINARTLETIVQQNATDYGAAGFDTDSGFGIINPLKTIKTLNQ